MVWTLNIVFTVRNTIIANFGFWMIRRAQPHRKRPEMNRLNEPPGTVPGQPASSAGQRVSSAGQRVSPFSVFPLIHLKGDELMARRMAAHESYRTFWDSQGASECFYDGGVCLSVLRGGGDTNFQFIALGSAPADDLVGARARRYPDCQG
jgi:hypothetical protein